MAAAMGIPILANEIAQRVAYAESLTMGKMIFEWAPESPAACEIEKLTKEILPGSFSPAGEPAVEGVFEMPNFGIVGC